MHIVKKGVVQNEEKFLGTFEVIKDENNIYNDNTIKQFKVTYDVWGKEYNLKNEYISKVMSFVIPNCTSTY